MQELIFHAMGSEIFCGIDSDSRRAHERLERVPAMFEAWEETLSRFRSHSELSQLNARAGETVRVSETLWRVLKLARRAEQWSAALVTPTILPALHAAGYVESFVPARNLPASAPPPQPVTPGASLWSMNEATHTIRLAPGVRLDLGGVAKGWAAEQTAELLAETGATMVDAGGDMVITAPRAGGAWEIGIENPFAPDDDETMPRLHLARGAVATSGRDYRKWTGAGGQPAHHLIDPRTGLPAVTDVLTATVIAPTLFQAEVAAKVALILGSAQGLKWIEARCELAALLILQDETILMSSQMEKFIA